MSSEFQAGLRDLGLVESDATNRANQIAAMKQVEEFAMELVDGDPRIDEIVFRWAN